MAVKSGFYNALDSDRRYDAHSIGQIFDGVLLDGVSNTIGKKFECKLINDTTISVDTGFAYFKGHYIYNDALYQYEIPEDAYPPIAITSIVVKTPPNQLHYPSGKSIQLDDIKIEGVPESLVVDHIEINSTAQPDYPSGYPVDLGDLRIMGVFDETPILRTGSCYIVIQLNYRERNFEIKAIRLSEYNSNIHMIIAKVTRTVSSVTIKNYVGYQDGTVSGPYLSTGLIQRTYITSLENRIDNEMSMTIPIWFNVRSTKFTSWLTNNEYYLYHHDSGPSQYERFVAALNDKSNKVTPYNRTLEANTSYTVFNISTPDNCYIDIMTDPYDVIITGIEANGSIITLHYNKIDSECRVKIMVY